MWTWCVLESGALMGPACGMDLGSLRRFLFGIFLNLTCTWLTSSFIVYLNPVSLSNLLNDYLPELQEHWVSHI